MDNPVTLAFTVSFGKTVTTKEIKIDSSLLAWKYGKEVHLAQKAEQIVGPALTAFLLAINPDNVS